jgi:hypothetical protein
MAQQLAAQMRDILDVPILHPVEGNSAFLNLPPVLLAGSRIRSAARVMK